jgi:hypothetical protein
MTDKEILRTQAAQYRNLADQLLESFGELDDDPLKDTLHGLSEFPDMIEEIVRSSLEDELLITGLKSRIAEMAARLTRFQNHNRHKRQLACWAMGAGGLYHLKCPDFSVSYRQGVPNLEVADETKLPDEYLVPQPPKADRIGLTLALKGGQVVEGALMVPGAPHIQVRTR